MGDADFWDLLVKSGVEPDSATAIVKTHSGMSNADLWDRLVNNNVAPDAATTIVHARGSDPTALSGRNLLRSAGQGATLGFSDEMGLADRGAEEAFAKAHPIADFGAKVAGGVLPAAGAIAALPVLGATAAGAAALGGGLGALTGIGEGDNAHDRTVGGITGGIGGALLGLLGHGAGKLFGSVAGSVADRAHPDRAVARAASDLLDGEADKVGATMDEVNKLAPGGASVYSTSVGPVSGKSRFLSMVRGVGANPKAASTVEQMLTHQNAALKAGSNAIGSQMDDLGGQIDVTPGIRNAISKASEVLGSKHTPALPDQDFRLIADATPDEELETAQSPNPSLREGVKNFWDRQTAAYLRNPGTETVAQKGARTALERHGAENVVSPSLSGSRTVIPGQQAQYEPETVDVQVLRDALGRLRYMARQGAKRGVDANGATLNDITSARDLLQKEIYAQRGDFAKLDRNYALLANQRRQVLQGLKTTELSRQNYGANDAFGASAGSLGGSLPKGAHGVTMALLDKILTDKAGAADAVRRMVVAPGTSASVRGLLSTAPKTASLAGTAVRGGLLGASAAQLPAALRGLLTSGDVQP